MILKVDIPPEALQLADKEIISRLADALELGTKRNIRQVGQTLWYLESSGIIRATLMRDIRQILLFDYPGSLHRINWGHAENMQPMKWRLLWDSKIKLETITRYRAAIAIPISYILCFC